MTTTRIRQEIGAALQTANKVSIAEARRIVASAQDGKVTAAEARLIGDLFQSAARSEKGAPSMTAGARDVFEDFFVRFGLPMGSGLKVVRGRIEATLADAALGAPLAKAPSTGGSCAVPIDASRTAYLNLSKGSFFLKDVSSGRARWYGPVALQAQPSAGDYAAIARRVLAELGLERMSLSISESEAARQSALGGAVGFEKALRASLESFLHDGEECESVAGLVRELMPIEGVPEGLDVDASVQHLMNRPQSLLALVPPAPSDEEKAQGIFPAEGGERVEQCWVFALRVPSLSDTLHWAITDRSGARPTYNYGFN